MKPIEEYLRAICQSRELGTEVAHREYLPPREPTWAELSAPLSTPLRSGLIQIGIRRLYRHQAEALSRVLAGEDVVVVTPTASGKTLCYNLPVIQDLADRSGGHALYLFPIKALEQDQLGALRELAGAAGVADRVTAEIYDGDTPDHLRRKVRQSPPSVIISNPDMVHMGLLAYHESWGKFFPGLKFIVLDEVHTYRGVFGSHVANVLRRLLRVAAHYGSRPQVIACSGTIANPGSLVAGLVGREPRVVDKNGAPAAGQHFLFINPRKISASTVASRLLRDAVNRDLATIVFTKARKITELIYTWTLQSDPRLHYLISAYRAGYLPEERREIERKLFAGEMKGVVSTSALEMGIDIGALDVCVLVGYPGAIATTWQRSGRVGRQDRESLIVLIAGEDALDQYFMRYPRVFFESGFEPAVIDPRNRPILKSHLSCAAAELPLMKEDAWFSGPAAAEAVAELEREGQLLKAVEESAWHSRRRHPQREVNIRGIGEGFTIFEEPAVPLPAGKKPKVIGSLDGNRVFGEGHAGAIYLHRGRQYQVTRLDLARQNLLARPVNVNYYTVCRKEKETEILGLRRAKPVHNFVVRLGELKITEQVIGYEKRRIASGERLSVHDLDLPPYSFETVGLWIEIDDFIPRAVDRRRLNFMGGIHSVEHAAIALFPLFALCERDDVGGISTPLHPQLGKAAIFIYDGYPGGVGLSEQSFARIEALLEATWRLIRECECENGCPACIHSPKCGSGNHPLDKAAALMVLSLLLDKAESKKWVAAKTAAEPPEEPIPPVRRKEESAEEPRVLVLDVETRRGAEEVGGWNNTHLMGVAVVVVWDTRTREFKTYRENQVPELFALLKTADLVVGFNILGFDYKVLSAYDNGTLAGLPTFDLLLDLHARLGYRLSLAHLAEQTLGKTKNADGLQSLQWVKEGRLDLVEEYCRRDVEITRDLFYHGLQNGFLRFREKSGRLMELTLDWEIKTLIREAGK